MRRPHAGCTILWLISTLVMGGCGAVEKVEDQLSAAKAQNKAQAMQQREQMCEAANGMFADVDISACTNGVATLQAAQISQEQTCTGGEKTHFEGQCLQRDPQGLIYFCDGPSVPAEFFGMGENLGEGTNLLQWNGFFWRAGVNHDYCYHHGGPTYGYTQSDCDGQMLDDLVALCSQKDNASFPWFSKDRCTINAQIMYAAVRQFGADNFQRMATHVDYPPYQPLWRALGFSEAPDDPALRGAIDKVL